MRRVYSGEGPIPVSYDSTESHGMPENSKQPEITEVDRFGL